MSLSPPVDGRLGVAKTYKLYVGGAFPRSESGRSYPVTDTKGRLLAHAALASRKDLRDAVSAARAALPGWSGATAYNRGPGALPGRGDAAGAPRGVRRRRRRGGGDQPQDGGRGRRRRRRPLGLVRGLDRQDRHGAGVGATRSRARTSTSPRRCRRAWSGCSRPPRRRCTGLVDVLAPVLATGCTAVVVASTERPLPAVELAEVLATSDVPGGVVNLLTGPRRRAGAVARRARRRRRAGPRRGARGRRRRPGARGGRHREARAAPPGTDRRAGPAARVDGAHDRVAPRRALSPARHYVSGPWPATSSPSSSPSPRATSSRCGRRGGARTARSGRRSSATTTRSSPSRAWPSSPRSSAPSPSTTWPTTRRGRWCPT